MANTKNSAQWVDVLRPSKNDLESLAKNFYIHPLILEELKGPSARSRVELYDGYLYLIYYFPVYDPAEKTSRRAEIDFLISKNTVATIHYEKFEALENFKAPAGKSSLEVVYKLIEALLNFEERQLRHIREEVEKIGKGLFNDKENAILKEISYIKRDISEYRVIVRSQGVILKSLVGRGIKFWGQDSVPYLDDLVGDHLKIVDQIEDYRQAISDFEDTNNQLMNLKINSAMKTFTALSFLTFPFMLIATIFSMRTQDMPLVNAHGAFWIIVGFMALAIITLSIYFKKRGWF